MPIHSASRSARTRIMASPMRASTMSWWPAGSTTKTVAGIDRSTGGRGALIDSGRIRQHALRQIALDSATVRAISAGNARENPSPPAVQTAVLMDELDVEKIHRRRAEEPRDETIGGVGRRSPRAAPPAARRRRSDDDLGAERLRFDLVVGHVDRRNAKSRCRVLNAERASTRNLASSAPSGSSSRKSWGLRTSARPIATRCFWPPESWCG